MSIQIQSGVSSSVPQTNVGATSTAAPGTAPPVTVLPQYQFDFSGLTRAASLGLAAPSSAGDLEVLFARISTALNKALGDLAEMDDVSQSERFRGRLGEARAAFEQMVRYGQTIDDNNENITRQNKVEAEQIVLRDAAAQRQQSLEGRKSTIESDIRTNNGTIITLRGENTKRNDERNDLTGEQNRITGDKRALENQRNALMSDPVKNKSQIDQINGKIGAIDTRLGDISRRIDVLDTEMRGFTNEIGRLQQANNDLQTELSGVEGRIKEEKDKVADASNRIVEADRSRKESQATITRTQRAMESFIDNTIVLVLVANGQTKKDMGLASGQITTEGDAFEALLQDMARALLEVGSAIIQSETGSDVALHTSGAGLNQTQATPDRFGQLSAPVARAIAFAGMIAGVLGAVADLLGGLSRGLGMQTAQSFATQGEPRVRVGL